MQHYLENLTPTQSTEYSLLKVTKKIRTSQHFISLICIGPSLTWAKNNQEKAQLFDDHLTNLFRIFPPKFTIQSEERIRHFLYVQFQIE